MHQSMMYYLNHLSISALMVEGNTSVAVG